MASGIKQIIRSNQSKAQKLFGWEGIKEQAAIKRQCELYDLLSKHFLNLITIMVDASSNQTHIQHLSPAIIENKRQKIVKCISEKHSINPKILQRIFGIFIHRQFDQNKLFTNIKEQIQLEDFNLSQSDIEESSILSDKDQFSQFLRNASHQNQIFFSQEDQNTSASTYHSQNIQSFQQKYQNQKSLSKSKGKFETPNDPHSLKVLAYLQQLTAPQTELTYLCQTMGWKHYFTQQATNQIPYFQAKCIVEFEYKTKKENKTTKHSSAKNKKQGRMIVAYKMLRMIYIQYPSVWDIYQQIKKKKCLHLSMSQNQTEKLRKINIEENKDQELIRKQQSKKQEDEKAHIKQYMQSIKSFKAQINLLIQQNPKTFQHPKMQKMQNGYGPWTVKGTLNVDHKGSKKSFIQMTTNHNSKEAEQIIAKNLIEKLYKNYTDIFQKMVNLKYKKKIQV